MLCWMWKDFGWMTNNAYVGIPYGIISFCLVAFATIYDRRPSMIWLHLSLVCWIVGNFLWMCSEFIFTTPSLPVTFGPNLPLGGLPSDIEQKFLSGSTVLFSVGVLIQIIYYFRIVCGLMPQPGEEDGPDGDDVMTRNDIEKMCLTGPTTTYTSSFLEHIYVIFWVMKDLFWGLGTGTVEGLSGRTSEGRKVVIFFESAAIISAAGSLFSFLMAAYLSRRNGTRFLDAVSGVCWILANSVWMVGEFFLRYDNLEMDDGDQGNDIDGRVASSFFFSVGIMIQMYLIARLVYMRCCGMVERCNTNIRVHSSAFSPLGQGDTGKYSTHTYTPQKTQDDLFDLEAVVF